jgi:hypothetical protein
MYSPLVLLPLRPAISFDFLPDLRWVYPYDAPEESGFVRKSSMPNNQE